jgi:diaminohydroxyphosphoribosylaminopyrimidine deaminase/5-amino-6-(5-phosphoribosylamino)uracil reductase
VKDFKQEEVAFMRLALSLALKGRGYVEPNPLVGCVIVKGNKILGRGHHAKFGGPHAEINALKAVASPEDATMYVTLEPCCHWGKTPPCTDAIVKARIGEVVAACLDPNPKVNGKGLESLKKAGIKVRVGLLESEAKKTNAPYFKVTTTGIPYVIAKWAMTLDGKIATVTGDSKWISDEKARRYWHRFRATAAAVIVGVNTILRDDPLLTVRYAGTRRKLARIVLDAMARTPLTASVVRTASRVPTIIVVGGKAPLARRKALESAGCEVLRIGTKRGRFINLKSLLQVLGKRSFTTILIEGGGEVIASAFEDGVVDRVLCFVSPKIVGGRLAKSPVEGIGIRAVRDAVRLEEVKLKRFYDTFLIDGVVAKS